MKRRGPFAFVAFDVLAVNGRDVRKPPLVEQRRSFARSFRRSAAILVAVVLASAPAVWLAACGGTLSGAAATRETPSASAPASEPAAADARGTRPPEARNSLPAPVAAAPATKPSRDARDEQMKVLTQAVSALHQEVSRNDARSGDLLKENKRLRAEVESLHRGLSMSRSEDQRLEAQLRALERELREIRPTPPLAGGEPGAGGDEFREAAPRAPGEAGKRVRGKPPAGAPGEPKRGVYHVAVAGDTLFGIATAYGVDYRDLARENGIADPEHIEVGQRILIPGTASGP